MLAVPDRGLAFTVFAQQDAPSLPIAELVQRAARFFATTLELTGEDRTGLPDEVVTARVTANGEARTCFGRPRVPDDLAAAEEAETRAGYTGMSLLAARCRTVWLVEVTATPDDTALLVAAVLASVLLGPILSPDGTELFGVKTARGKLGR
jgi:hypothetical protein